MPWKDKADIRKVKSVKEAYTGEIISSTADVLFNPTAFLRKEILLRL